MQKGQITDDTFFTWQNRGSRGGLTNSMSDTNHIMHGDALHELKNIEDNSVDLVCTDPPYGYSFMGKDWDKAVPSVEIWEESLRVLKPGAFCFVMSAPRSDVQNAMISRLMEAGFRLDFTPIYWTYASGFPKAGNIGKLVDKRLGNERKSTTGSTSCPDFPEPCKGHPTANGSLGGGVMRHSTPSKGTSELEGSYAGFQPKPAVEVIIVAMKPLSEKTFVDQALKNGKGISWLDDGRIPIDKTSEPDKRVGTDYVLGERKGIDSTGHFGNSSNEGLQLFKDGRFPANLLVSDDVLNNGVISKSTGGDGYKSSMFIGGKPTGGHGLGDVGSYSRYFDLDKWASTLPFLIVPKASKSEKGADNKHPTVKPLKLMSYLITLGSREGDTILDPFVGSGTTCLAAKKLNRDYIGIEKESEYVEIAEARLKQEVQASLL